MAIQLPCIDSQLTEARGPHRRHRRHGAGAVSWQITIELRFDALVLNSVFKFTAQLTKVILKLRRPLCQYHRYRARSPGVVHWSPRQPLLRTPPAPDQSCSRSALMPAAAALGPALTPGGGTQCSQRLRLAIASAGRAARAPPPPFSPFTAQDCSRPGSAARAVPASAASTQPAFSGHRLCGLLAAPPALHRSAARRVHVVVRAVPAGAAGAAAGDAATASAVSDGTSASSDFSDSAAQQPAEAGPASAEQQPAEAGSSPAAAAEEQSGASGGPVWSSVKYPDPEVIATTADGGEHGVLEPVW